MAAMAEAALHIPLHRDVDPVERDAALEQARAAKCIMISGPQTNAIGRGRDRSGPRDQLRDDADLAVPAALGGVDRDVDLEVEPAAEAAELLR